MELNRQGNSYFDKPDESSPDVFVHYADLDHDGADEKIVVDLKYKNTGTISVFKGEKYIWSDHTSIRGKDEGEDGEEGWTGHHLYEEDGKSYLLTWSHYMYNGEGQYGLYVFNFDRNGDQVDYLTENVMFNIYSGEYEPNTVSEARELAHKANQYLEKSIVLISCDNGKFIYSTEGNPITETFDIEW